KNCDMGLMGALKLGLGITYPDETGDSLDSFNPADASPAPAVSSNDIVISLADPQVPERHKQYGFNPNVFMDLAEMYIVTELERQLATMLRENDLTIEEASDLRNVVLSYQKAVFSKLELAAGSSFAINEVFLGFMATRAMARTLSVIFGPISYSLIIKKPRGI